MGQKQIINDFLVDVFNIILRMEEKSLREHADGKLSLSEYHVIEAVCSAISSQKNTMSNIAKMLGITVGSLTVAVTTLEKKGYIERYKDEKDKRSVRLKPSEAGDEINVFHKTFHDEMMHELCNVLNEEQLDVMVDALIVLKKYFNKEI